MKRTVDTQHTAGGPSLSLICASLRKVHCARSAHNLPGERTTSTVLPTNKDKPRCDTPLFYATSEPAGTVALHVESNTHVPLHGVEADAGAGHLCQSTVSVTWSVRFPSGKSVGINVGVLVRPSVASLVVPSSMTKSLFPAGQPFLSRLVGCHPSRVVVRTTVCRSSLDHQRYILPVRPTVPGPSR